MLNISFKAYNNKKLKQIHQKINTSAWVWNHCVALQKRYYKLYGKFIKLYTLQKHIAKLRNKNPKWKELNAQSVQEICERVDTAYKRFFKKLSKRPPKFKKSKNFKSFVLKQNGWKVEDNVLIIGGVKYKFSKSRNYENIKRVTVKRSTLGEVFFIFCCDMKPKQFERIGNATIGMDFGLKIFLTLSDGKEINSPEFFKQKLNKTKRLSQQLSRKKKGSSNRRKALSALQKAHINISNKRSDFEWKLAHEFCRQYSFIAIEDLNIESMKKLWGRKVSDLSFSSFVNKLEQIALKYNTAVQKVGRYYASSKTCSCGSVNKELKLSDREWACYSCGEVHKRDLLAANNILSEGIRLYRTKCKADISSAI